MAFPPFIVDAASGVPAYEQLRLAIRDAVTGGTLAPGEKLPTVRALAERMTLSPHTVARVYRRLESDGFVETLGRNGTIVLGQGDAAVVQGRLAAGEYAARIRSLGVDPGTAVEWVRTALDD